MKLAEELLAQLNNGATLKSIKAQLIDCDEAQTIRTKAAMETLLKNAIASKGTKELADEHRTVEAVEELVEAHKVKRDYVELVPYLSANSDKTVGDVMPALFDMLRSSRSVKYRKNGDGVKASTSSGLNIMCSEGLVQWTKQNNDYNKAKIDLLPRIASGAPVDVTAELDTIKAAKVVIKPHSLAKVYRSVLTQLNFKASSGKLGFHARSCRRCLLKHLCLN